MQQKTPQPPVLALQVGNTRIKLAIFREAEPEDVVFVAKEDAAGAVEAATRLFEQIGAEIDASVVVASVNPPVSEPLVSRLRDQLGCDVFLVPEDMPVPIGTCLEPGSKPGVDRLLNAAAAFDRLRQACIVIDAGTCITVDFVDGEGVFHGGAIAPGLRMQLRALHEQTAALPLIDFAPPEGTAWGGSTREAILRGVYHGARGLAWRLVERYAEEYGGFPAVIATGGDARALFADDELVQQIVPDLVLRGIALAARSALAPEGDAGQPGPVLTVGDDGEDGLPPEALRERAKARGEGFSLLPRQTEPLTEPKSALPGKARPAHEHGCGDDDCGCGH